MDEQKENPLGINPREKIDYLQSVHEAERRNRYFQEERGVVRQKLSSPETKGAILVFIDLGTSHEDATVYRVLCIPGFEFSEPRPGETVGPKYSKMFEDGNKCHLAWKRDPKSRKRHLILESSTPASEPEDFTDEGAIYLPSEYNLLRCMGPLSKLTLPSTVAKMMKHKALGESFIEVKYG